MLAPVGITRSNSPVSSSTSWLEVDGWAVELRNGAILLWPAKAYRRSLRIYQIEARDCAAAAKHMAASALAP